ncbi:MAG: serine protease [Patescibacteria group bacterium]|nr:serine protease [Patescibacteria group bacterium]
MRFLDKSRILVRKTGPHLKKTARILLVMTLLVGVAFLAGVIGGLAVSGHWDSPELPRIRQNWEATVFIPLPGNHSGTGIAVSEDGHILTNEHVLSTALGAPLSVIVDDGSGRQTFEAEIVDVDEEHDLALLRINHVFNDPVVLVSNDLPPAPGSWTYGIGFPFGLRKQLSQGYISSKRFADRSSKAPAAARDAIMLHGQFEPGMSGAGVFDDEYGHLVGMNSMSIWMGDSTEHQIASPLVLPVRNIRAFLDRNNVPHATPDAPWWEYWR